MLGIINMKKKKKFKLGTWITSFNRDSLEIIASFKFDWIAVDLEHSTISFEQLSIMISIIQKTGTEAWVRVGKNDEYLIQSHFEKFLTIKDDNRLMADIDSMDLYSVWKIIKKDNYIVIESLKNDCKVYL